MNEDELYNLLSQTESPSLEFKQEWYTLESEDKEGAKRQKQELVKDILSLANGHTTTAGQDAYLIIGAANKLNDDGTRDLTDMGELTITSQQLQGWVNNYAEPPLGNIRCQAVPIKGKMLWVITILATPHLYETSCKLTTPKREFTEHVLFIRHDENIKVASATERAELAKHKKVKFAERHNVDPISYGAAVGAIVGGITTMGFANKTLREQASPIWASTLGLLIGSVITGWSGHSIGHLTKEINTIRQTEWPFYTLRKRFYFITASALYMLFALGVMARVIRWLNKRDDNASPNDK